MDINDLLYRPRLIDLGLWLSRKIPPRAGYKLADFIAGRIAAQKGSPTTRAIRANQWVANGEDLTGEELDQLVLDTLQNTAYGVFDLFHTANNPTAIMDLIVFSPDIEKLIQLNITGELNGVVLGLHMSNYDLVAQAVFQRGLRALVISLPETSGAVDRQHAMREKAGFEIYPASISTFHKAIKHLRAGGSVVTGLDRPVQEIRHYPRFFGRPSHLSTMAIYLATTARVPVVVTAAIKQPDNKYHLIASDLIPMQPHPDRDTEILQNTEAILDIAATFIRQAPTQWGMPKPVWPEILDQLP